MGGPPSARRATPDDGKYGESKIDPPQVRCPLIGRDRWRAGACIDRGDPNVVAPDFGSHESVHQHTFGLILRVGIRARIKNHDDGQRLVVPVQIDVVFATKSHWATPIGIEYRTGPLDLTVQYCTGRYGAQLGLSAGLDGNAQEGGSETVRNSLLRDAALFVQNEIQQGLMHLDIAVVADEAELSKPVHEIADP